jgi:cation:H+ antiporter
MTEGRQMPLILSSRLALLAAVAVPAVVLRASGQHGPAPVALLIFGIAVLAASFLLAWAADAAQVDISGGLAIAILALIAVLPEYAIDLYFAYTAGHEPEFASYAAANMTGSNRLLLGLGWPLVGFVTLWALSRRRGRSIRELLLSPRRRVELAFLGVAAVIAFVMPVTAQIHVALGAVLLVVFGAYLWRVSRGEVTEPELLGTSAHIAELPQARRRWTVAGLFAIAAVIVVASAEPFANALIDTGSQLGVDRFLLVQWLAPLASEAPEFIVAILLARRGNGDDAMGTLLSSKVNQWTLLIGTLPLAYLLGGGGAALPLDSRQVEEVLLTATQTALGFAVLVRLRFHLRAAITLLALFAVQFAFPGTTVRLVISAIYAALALAVLVVHRRDLRVVVDELRPSRRWATPARYARRTAVTLAGIGLLVTGIVLLVAPGPGLVVVALALLVLGTEYEWARRRYDDIRRRAEGLAERAVARRTSLAMSTVGGVGMVGAGVLLIVIEELPGAGLASGLTLSGGGAIVLATLAYAYIRSRSAYAQASSGSWSSLQPRSASMSRDGRRPK